MDDWARCARCGKKTRRDRLVKGFGRGCAAFLGLVGDTTDTGHVGPDLLDLLTEATTSPPRATLER